MTPGLASPKLNKAMKNILSSVLDELVVTDTIPLREDAEKCPKIRQLSIAQMLAETMRRISEEESVSSLFMDWEPFKTIECVNTVTYKCNNKSPQIIHLQYI